MFAPEMLLRFTTKVSSASFLTSPLMVTAICFEVRGDLVAGVHFVRNPDKLRWVAGRPA